MQNRVLRQFLEKVRLVVSGVKEKESATCLRRDREEEQKEAPHSINPKSRLENRSNEVEQWDNSMKCPEA